MIKRLLFILVLTIFAGPAFAQDQVLEPNATASETNSDCTTTDAHTRNNDDNDTTFCDGGDGSSAESYVLLFDFPTPTSAPDTTASAQQFVVRAQRSSGSGTGPTIAANFFCNGTLVASGSAQDVTSTTPANFNQSFTFPGSPTCAGDGSDVQIEVNVVRTGGSPGSRVSADSIDVDWNVTWAATGTRRVFMVSQDGP